MALYLGDLKVKLQLDSNVYRINLFPEPPTITGGLLKTSEGYILKSSDDLYLTVKEDK